MKRRELCTHEAVLGGFSRTVQVVEAEPSAKPGSQVGHRVPTRRRRGRVHPRGRDMLRASRREGAARGAENGEALTDALFR